VNFIKIDVEGSEGPILQNMLDTLQEFPNLTSLAVEISANSAHFVQKLIAADFKAYALPNNYRIGYLFVRQYLARSHEGGFVVKLPMQTYDSEFTDYVFERQLSSAAPRVV
jgi:hypothetical protein